MLNIRQLPSCSTSFCLCLCYFCLYISTQLPFVNLPWPPWQSPLLCHYSTIRFVLNASISTQYLLILYKYFAWQHLFPLSVQGESGTVYIWWSLRDRYARFGPRALNLEILTILTVGVQSSLSAHWWWQWWWPQQRPVAQTDRLSAWLWQWCPLLVPVQTFSWMVVLWATL